MGKEEILKKSREEWDIAVERECRDDRSAAMALLFFIAFVSVFLFAWDFAHGLDISGWGAILLSFGAAGGFFAWRTTRFGGYLFCAALTGLGALSMLASHIMGTW